MDVNALFQILIFFLGATIGSFLNVCIYRIPKGESIAYPPSHCTNCNGKIKFYDLFPIISWMFLKGKCRNCREKISIRYPLVEFFTGICFLLIFLKYGLTIETLKFSLLTVFLIVIGLIDYDTMDVYTFITWSGIILGGIFIIISYFRGQGVLTYVYGVLLGGGFIALIIILTSGMGWGDVEICALSGIFLGFSNTVVMLFFSFICGGVIGAILIITGKKGRKEAMPFGPFIALASIITILIGDAIINWYIGRFF
ncbi:A24 family peptidase [Hathewaya histolytica]|uniref:Type IV leader peptidase/N-methyltransferase n=1 Tax=Hathewaya histolytica TaxID=1498 RepID=A0A4U9R5H2_HATHI|nr:A24 family peptidase [Hathewaya histolytica]VTQ86684.1 type IV leader peptidase/N-methyltransferase [Hathewaya histolytica]